MTGVLWVVVPVALMAGMYWLSYRIEPHWVSKDGCRFMCMVQPVTISGVAEGRAQETRVMVLPDGHLQLDRRRPIGRRIRELWTVAGKSPDPPAKRQVYVLNAAGDDGTAGHLAMKLPSTSRAVPVLDELLQHGR